MPPYPGAIERFPTVRQSLLAVFDACAMAMEMKETMEKGWHTAPQGRGTLLHRVYAECLMTMVREKTDHIEVDVALAILRDKLRQADVPLRDVVPVPMKEIKDMRWEVVSFAHNMRWDIKHLVAVEERLQSILRYDDPDGGWVERLFTGQLDALFIEGANSEHAIVVDYKSTWALPPEKGISESGYFQQRAYALLVFDRYPGVQRVTTREVYTRYLGNKTGKNPVREGFVDRADIEDLREELSALVERFDRAVQFGLVPWDPQVPEIREGVELIKDAEERARARRGLEGRLNLLAPTPGKHCNFCPDAGRCPIFPDSRAEGAIPDAETAKRYAAEAIVAKVVLDTRTKALKAWADKNGPVPIKDAKDPDRAWGFVFSSRTDRPSKEALEAAIARGEDPATLYVEKTATRFQQGTFKPVDSVLEDADLEAALLESIAEQERRREEG